MGGRIGPVAGALRNDMKADHQGGMGGAGRMSRFALRRGGERVGCSLPRAFELGMMRLQLQPELPIYSCDNDPNPRYGPRKGAAPSCVDLPPSCLFVHQDQVEQTGARST